MFWRREGGPLDIKNNSPMAWLLRIIAVVLIAAVVVMMFRLAAPRAAAADLPYAIDAGWKGEKVCELLSENEHMRVARCTFAPGVGHERHWHPPHYGYILKGGTMRITDAEGTREQETPDNASWWSDGVDWHEAVNIGETTTVYLIFEPKSAGAVASTAE